MHGRKHHIHHDHRGYHDHMIMILVFKLLFVDLWNLKIG
jgi:hypothetical protein